MGTDNESNELTGLTGHHQKIVQTRYNKQHIYFSSFMGSPVFFSDVFRSFSEHPFSEHLSFARGQAVREPLREIGPLAASLFVLVAWHPQAGRVVLGSKVIGSVGEL